MNTMNTIKARYDGRVLIPERPLDLVVGAEVEISISSVASEAQAALLELAKIADRIPPNPDLPTDLAAQHDHYLYGTPKRP